MPTIDFVIPVFNEEEGLSGFHKLLDETQLPADYSRRYVYVDDGSTDNTAALLDRMAATDSRITAMHLSRNFGHQAALSAGLDAASADVIISMDGDGQHPPAIIPEMLRLHAAGYEIVQAQRLDDVAYGPLLKRLSSRLFYWLVSLVGEVNLAPG